ncbi:MAG: flagellar protein FlaG [Gallionella sp.]|jgi:flagellar protein FlaG
MLIQNLSANVAQAPQPARQASESTAIPESATTTQALTEKPVPAAQLHSAVQNANQAMQSSNRDLAFSVDTETKQTVVKLMDTKTGDVIGQFPTHQMLEISKAIGLMQEQLQQASLSKAPTQSTPGTQGMLIKQQA